MFGGLTEILIWGSEIAKSPPLVSRWDLNLGGAKILRGGGAKNPNDAMDLIY